MTQPATTRRLPVTPVSPAISPLSRQPTLDDIVSSTMERRAAARKQARQANNAKAIDFQVKKTRALINNAAASREAQNAAIADLVTLCGSENNAAVRLGKAVCFVQKRNFETSEVFADLRALWPNTESSVLMMLIAKAKSHPDRFEKYMRPFLDGCVRQQILRSEFMAAWARAMNDGLLPEEVILREKNEAEEVAEMALTETGLLEQELKTARDARAALEAKVQALEAALGHQVDTKQATGGLLDDSLTMTMENLMRGKRRSPWKVSCTTSNKCFPTG